MEVTPDLNLTQHAARSAIGLTCAMLLAGCGGGDAPSGSGGSGSLPGTVSTGTVVFELRVNSPTTQVALPSYHLLPVLPAAPDGADAIDNGASAGHPPQSTRIPEAWRQRPTARLTLDDILRADGGGALPMGSSSSAVTYTPAQIRAAYEMPALPASGATPTATQAAQMGAGQTIYIVDAMSDPNVAAELATFNQTFGLPACTSVAIATSAQLPLAAPSAGACQFSVVYSSSAGGMTATAPSYDSGWATEIALDVQWVHATAPLARIVLIEAPSSSVNDLLAAVDLADAMGPGVVSMSFGSSEGSWTASVDSAFTASGMSYLAATGDSGAAVQWPAVSTHVLAVGGTSLTYSGSGTRSEVVWSDTGGGVSQYTAAPSYQNNTVPGMGSPSYRNVGDVSFNANPYTGQYLAVMAPGSSSASWLSAGGTSLATPQWAGLLAVANALRAQSSHAMLGAPHATLYGQVAAVAGTYAADLDDITQGSDGSCSTCSAKVGYDTPSGLGTPNATALLSTLAGSAAASAPVVTSATVDGTVGTALSYTVAVSAPDSVSYTLGGAPSGMSISSAAVLSWPAPTAGTHQVTVTAKDSKTGLAGEGTITVVISTPAAPVVASASISGRSGVALTYPLAVTAVDPVTWSLSGAPSGMAVSTSGTVSWAAPRIGTYTVTATAKDTKTGLTGQGTLIVAIAAPTAPVVAGGSEQGIAGTALSFSAAVPGSDAMSYSLSGAPAGMSISNAGVVSWAAPVVGTYDVAVTAKDATTGLSGQGTYVVTIVAASGPTISASTLDGTAGQALSGSIRISDTEATMLSVAISGIPLGMSFTPNGLTLAVSWPSPVAGSYTLQVVVVDNAGNTAKAAIPVSIAP